MKANTAFLNGKPDVGNPHAWFDEVEVASCHPSVGLPNGIAARGAKTRRGTLLYKESVGWMTALFAIFAITSAFGVEDAQPKEATAVSHMEGRTKNPNRDPGLFGDYWWANRFLSRRQAIEKVRGQEVDLVLLGDSICHFWEWQHPDSWAKLTASRTVLNLGYGGDATQHVIWRVEHGELDGYTAKAIVLMIGTNNNSSDTTNPTNVAKGVERIVSLVRARQPKAKLVLHPIFPRGVSAESVRHAAARARNETTNTLLKEFAEKDGKIVWIDFNNKFLDASGWVPKSLMADEIHPTDKGYDIWMAALADAGVIVPVESEVFVRSTADKTLQPAKITGADPAGGM